MNNLIDSFSNRLCKAIKIRNIKPSELSEQTGIDKSKLSSYMSGRYKAKQDGIYLLSNVLDVDPAWLMGYNVPMERASISDFSINEAIKHQYGDSSIILLDYYLSLNNLGKEKALENIEDLTKINEYTEIKNESQNA